MRPCQLEGHVQDTAANPLGLDAAAQVPENIPGRLAIQQGCLRHVHVHPHARRRRWQQPRPAEGRSQPQDWHVIHGPGMRNA